MYENSAKSTYKKDLSSIRKGEYEEMEEKIKKIILS